MKRFSELPAGDRIGIVIGGIVGFVLSLSLAPFLMYAGLAFANVVSRLSLSPGEVAVASPFLTSVAFAAAFVLWLLLAFSIPSLTTALVGWLISLFARRLSR